jgi:hypothetical protein
MEKLVTPIIIMPIAVCNLTEVYMVFLSIYRPVPGERSWLFPSYPFQLTINKRPLISSSAK